MYTETYKKVYSRISPGEQAMDAVRRACITQETPKKRRRGVSVRAILIAAVIAALTLTTALAFGDVVKEFVFGNSVARQRVAMYLEDRSIYISRMIYAKEAIYEKDEPRTITLYGSGDRAKMFRMSTEIQPLEQPFDASLFPYEIKEPTYLTEGVEGLSEVFGMIGEGVRSGAKTYSVTSLYNVALPNEGGHFLADGTLELSQVYFGPNISLKVETPSQIDKVMVGDCEAMLITNDVLFAHLGSMTTTTYYLIWIENDVYYELRNSFFVTIGLDEMIAIAESLA